MAKHDSIDSKINYILFIKKIQDLIYNKIPIFCFIQAINK